MEHNMEIFSHLFSTSDVNMTTAIIRSWLSFVSLYRLCHYSTLLTLKEKARGHLTMSISVFTMSVRISFTYFTLAITAQRSFYLKQKAFLLP